MAENEAQSGTQTAIVPAQERQWLRLPDESAQAYSALRAYLDVDPAKRSIAAAYRQLKSLDADEKVRVPGYFGPWAARFRWQQRADAWDAFLDQLAIVVNAEELAAARKQTAELSARLMGFVETELRRFESAPAMSSMATDERLRMQNAKAYTLARLAAALESAARARIAALDTSGQGGRSGAMSEPNLDESDNVDRRQPGHHAGHEFGW